MPEKTKEIAVDSVVYEGATGTVFELIAIEGTVWMTMQQMAVVFGVDRSVVGKHVRNIYATEELERARTWAKFAQVRAEGGRRVTRNNDPSSTGRQTGARRMALARPFPTSPALAWAFPAPPGAAPAVPSAARRGLFGVGWDFVSERLEAKSLQRGNAIGVVTFAIIGARRGDVART